MRGFFSSGTTAKNVRIPGNPFSGKRSRSAGGSAERSKDVMSHLTMSGILRTISDRRVIVSDGPHRTLNMSRAWKRFAERASKAAYSPEEVAECAAPALIGDWNVEVGSILRQVMDVLENAPSGSLFDDQRSRDIAAIAEGARTPFEHTLADAAYDAVSTGSFGPDCARAVVEAALQERGLRCARQVEEHWHREGATRSAAQVRARVERGIASVDIGEIARKICEGARLGARAPALRDGLDDGVRL